MKTRLTLIAAATLVLAACAKAPEPTPVPEPAPAPVAETPAPAVAPTAEAAPAPAAGVVTAKASGECAADLEAGDDMKYNAGNIDIPKTCKEFVVNFRHAGKMPITAMGHNVVIARDADMQAVVADGAAAPDHLKTDDTRVVAHSKMIGGGESTSFKVPVAKLADGSYKFFCTFPGHVAMMQGTVTLK